jgi:hypothetical protein
MGGVAFDRLNAGEGRVESVQQAKTTTAGLAAILSIGLTITAHVWRLETA